MNSIERTEFERWCSEREWPPMENYWQTWQAAVAYSIAIQSKNMDKENNEIN